jgi:hypothetical protein
VRSLRCGHWPRVTLAFGIGFLAFSHVAAAQVGVSSRVARIELLAHVPARADIQEVHPALHWRWAGSMRETSVGLRLAANGGYRLLVKAATRGAGSRVWVRAMDGRFRELVPGAAIVVAEDPVGTGEVERQVQYRVQRNSKSSAKLAPPVRYEIVVNPTL